MSRVASTNLTLNEGENVCWTYTMEKCKKYKIKSLYGNKSAIDQTYCSNSDQWCAMFYALRDGKINYNDRVCQFEIHKSIMNDFTFNEVDNLNNETRGGYGSTGVK